MRKERLGKMAKKKVLILVSNTENPDWQDAFGCDFNKLGYNDVVFEISSLSRLTILIDGYNSFIKDYDKGYDITDFDQVVFRGSIVKYEMVSICVGAYCRRNNIPYIDSCVPRISKGKLDGAAIRWEHGISVPKTAYGPADAIDDLARIIGAPYVFKANNGAKGEDNYLINNLTELHSIASNSNKDFVLQEFIPNDGDYRVLVFGHIPRLAMLRKANEDSYLNNTSQGGQARLVNVKDLPKGVAELAASVTKVDNLEVAGVDIIQNSNTDELYVLEDNRVPQISTGSYVESKTSEYVKYLVDLVKKDN